MTNRSSARGAIDESVLTLLVLLVVIAATAIAHGCWALGSRWAGIDQRIPANPIAAAGELVADQLHWPVHASVLVIPAQMLLVAAIVALVRWRIPRRRTPRARLDTQARLMTAPRHLGEVTGSAARRRAQRLRPGTPIVGEADIGIELGRTVIGDTPIFMGWEDVGVCFAGPRTGKTAALAIPALCAAPAAAIATSNKRDLRDHTRGVREKCGQVWESDLQGITGHIHQDWWWNPLTYVAGLGDARTLAGRFASAASEDNARVDAYFSGGSEELLALYQWAAAAGGGDLVHTLAWLADPDDSTAHQQLVTAGDLFAATKLATAQALNPRQRDGLYDMARRNLNVLNDPAAAATVVPPDRKIFDSDTTDLADWSAPGNQRLPQFDPVSFVRSTDTLYALSMEGPASATGLTTALVGCIIDQALTVARASTGGRLPHPLVAILDEAANVCRLKELPKLYSHLGSQGVVALTFLQSPAQGAEVWSPESLKQLAEQSNVHYYGGGIRDRTYLADLSALADDYDVSRWSRSRGRGGASTSQSWSREPILSIATLAALPKDRAVVWTAGNPPVLLKKTYWDTTEYADAIRDSLRRYGPDAATFDKAGPR
ncbi:TraM recognition domain-containing protein [Nocardia uniformis]|uniref:TraM recognition domain-containing protein n=1 Tax=Nocardia uniformis TaxID=53432 RepID=A0A849C5D9_9NOCA|nr:type IV secretory system conjugative DNA transfer family protein [Nocardia uniformis]NNH72998.1 TraM recognition domain-containing protein [Nocardia uniformis]